MSLHLSHMRRTLDRTFMTASAEFRQKVGNKYSTARPNRGKALYRDTQSGPEVLIYLAGGCHRRFANRSCGLAFLGSYDHDAVWRDCHCVLHMHTR